MAQPKVTVKVDAEGRIAIPPDVREELGLEPGDEITFAEGWAGWWHFRKEVPPRPPLSAAEWDAAIEEARRHMVPLDGRTADELIEEMRGPPLEPELRD